MAEREFECVDPYNPQNIVKGFVLNNSMHGNQNASMQDKRYGDLAITHVNGKSVEQYIHATPKFYYPGNRESPRATFSVKDFPDTRFKVFEKLDGTNIFMFKYNDVEGSEFISFKTRLTPFLKAEGFKDWISMFAQAVAKRPDLIEKFKKVPGGHAFEMYGYLNEILIKYEEDIDLRYLYSIDGEGKISYNHDDEAGFVMTGTSDLEALAAYKHLVEEAERLFKDGKRAEGYMLYFDDGTVYKCKPVCVVEEQSDSPFIGNDDIYVTAMNAAESIDSIDELLDTTRILLAEVYDQKKIERSDERIIAMVASAKDYLLVQKEAMSVMKELGFTWNEANKATIMRAVMQRFPKSMSPKIYGMLSGKKPTKKK